MAESPDFLNDPVSRRAFLARMSAAGLGVAATALLAGCGGNYSSAGPSAPTGPGPGPSPFFDPKNFPGIPGQNENLVVLNYALTLETLEADLYRQALNIAAGKDVATPLPADGGASYTQAVGNGSVSPDSGRRSASCTSSSMPALRPRTETSCGRPSPPSAARPYRPIPRATPRAWPPAPISAPS